MNREMERRGDSDGDAPRGEMMRRNTQRSESRLNDPF